MTTQASPDASGLPALTTSLYVAGWRPFIGWVCGLAFAWTFLLFPVLQVIIVASGLPVDLSKLPVPDVSQMMPAVLAMLGLGAMRSYERKTGAERNSMSGVTEINRAANSPTTNPQA